MITPTKTYYVIPIKKYDFFDQSEAVIFMVTINNFEKSYLNNPSRSKKFLMVMAIPAGIFFLLAAIIMTIIMRRNFNKIQKNSKKMSDYCGFIKLNDFDL